MLTISPWIVGYEDGDAIWNPIAFGALVALIATVRLAVAEWQSWLSWVNAAIGAWLLASAFWLADSTEASWNVGIVGAIVFVAAVVSATASDDGKRRSGRRGLRRISGDRHSTA